jgi:hypothetical protein
LLVLASGLTQKGLATKPPLLDDENEKAGFVLIVVFKPEYYYIDL